MLIAPTRERIAPLGIPYVIENVEDAPLNAAPTLDGGFGVMLCGRMFGLQLYRHRLFETSFPVEQPSHPPHRTVILGGRYLNKRYSQHGGVAGVAPFVTVAGHASGIMKFAPKAMGIDWMTRDELTQAIPPAFTEWIGARLMAALGQQETVA